MASLQIPMPPPPPQPINYERSLITPVYSRRRGRFVNSAFPNKKNLAQKSKFIYDKQIWKQMFVCRNSTLQVNREKECYRKTTSYLVSVAGVWKGRERGLREPRGAPLAFLSRLKLPSLPFQTQNTSYLEQPSLYFCQHFMRRTAQHTFLAIHLASQQKTTKLYFSSRVRKQFKLLTAPFKPLRCSLRKDKLVKNGMSENSAKIYF